MDISWIVVGIVCTFAVVLLVLIVISEWKILEKAA